MNSRARTISLTAVAVLATAALAAQKHYQELEYPKLRDVQIPKIEQLTLDNGLRLFLVEDHELPLIRISALIRVGSIYEPADKTGLASITGQVMRTGGTAGMSGDDMDEKLEALAASVETSIGQSSGSASVSVLKKDIDTGLAILSEVLRRPAFAEDKIELARVQARSSVSRRNDNVGGIASREYRKLIYGAESVYSRQVEYETIDNIRRDDLVAFHARYHHPNNVMMAAWGDFDTSEMAARIRDTFGGWERSEISFPEVPDVDYEFQPTVNLVTKEDVNQTSIYMGHIGTTRDDPDYFALILMNRILGGGFSSRLFREVRSRQGLAYSVFGNYSANFDHPGIFFVGCQTKSETTVQAIRAMQAEVRKMTEGEVTEEELVLARDAYLNTFVFNFDSTGEVVNRLMTYAYYGYPLDFLQKTKENVERVTAGDILRVARKHLHPEQMQVLAVGNPAQFDEPVSALGRVNEIDITIPEPEPEALPAATAETRAQGREALRNMAAAVAGAGVENYVQEMDIVLTMPQGQMQLGGRVTLVAPDRMEIILKTPMGEMRQVAAGETAWIVGPQGSMDMPEAQKREFRASLHRDLINLCRLAESDEIDVYSLGAEEVRGSPARVLIVTGPGGETTRLFLDSQTHLPVKQQFRGSGMTGPAELEAFYSDYRDVQGVQLPFGIEILADGQPQRAVTVTSIRINVEIDPAAFQKQ